MHQKIRINKTWQIYVCRSRLDLELSVCTMNSHFTALRRPERLEKRKKHNLRWRSTSYTLSTNSEAAPSLEAPVMTQIHYVQVYIETRGGKAADSGDELVLMLQTGHKHTTYIIYILRLKYRHGVLLLLSARWDIYSYLYHIFPN